MPELGTFVAERPPIAVLTSNRSRDLHDARAAAASTTGSTTRRRRGWPRSSAAQRRAPPRR